MSSFSFINGHAVSFDGTGLLPGESIDSKYFCCPYCGTRMYFVKASSSGRPPHFAGHHHTGCPNGRNDRIDPASLNMDGFSLESLYNSLLNPAVPSEPSCPASEEADSETASSDKENDSSIRIMTMKDLFLVCASNHPDTVLYKQTTIRDIFCGMSTMHDYHYKISGLHLVHAQCYSFNQGSQEITFWYPTADKYFTYLLLHALCDDKEIFMEVLNNLKFMRRKRFALILSNFLMIGDEGYCNIFSPNQIQSV